MVCPNRSVQTLDKPKGNSPAVILRMRIQTNMIETRMLFDCPIRTWKTKHSRVAPTKHNNVRKQQEIHSFYLDIITWERRQKRRKLVCQLHAHDRAGIFSQGSCNSHSAHLGFALKKVLKKGPQSEHWFVWADWLDYVCFSAILLCLIHLSQPSWHWNASEVWVIRF